MTKEQIIEQMAQAACKLRQADYEWTDEQMEIFMYKDPVGIRDMEKMRRVARVMYECINLIPAEDRTKAFEFADTDSEEVRNLIRQGR